MLSWTEVGRLIGITTMVLLRAEKTKTGKVNVSFDDCDSCHKRHIDLLMERDDGDTYVGLCRTTNEEVRIDIPEDEIR